ncbi:hypothetical protein ACHAXA_003677 [Cyclostephanos tholiformis]|uniref:Uncharacterized protein n=1 Tax=Cyclostephanos tholiformis TaxID=382380 RepID=A0ABD3SPW8_9STRA
MTTTMTTISAPTTTDGDGTTVIDDDDGGATTSGSTDQHTWWCGISWDWIESNCDVAVPCPGGDAIDCPSGMACFASTPCTLSPTSTPTSYPSFGPSAYPSMDPTRVPWGEGTFVDFLYGESSPSSGGGNDGDIDRDDDVDAAAAVVVNETSVDELRYHFFCGTSWTMADTSCSTYCPSGDKSDCPEGEDCYANTQCDGRDTPAPSVTPAPSTVANSTVTTTTTIGVEGKICSLCDDERDVLDASRLIDFQTQTTTCGVLNSTLAVEGILEGAGTCTSVRDAYRDMCCHERCRLCRTPDGTDLLDLKTDHTVKQGGYEATCREIDDILSASWGEETICSDAKEQLADQCCYRQCMLCATGTMETEWYNTVAYDGLSTTCLGLDYVLRAEQVSDGSYRCSELRGEYVSQCCRTSETACALCSSDGTMYDIFADKVVAEPSFDRQTTTTTCSAVSDSLTRFQKSDQECTEGKQALFGQCCDLSSAIVSGGGQAAPNAASNVTSGTIPNPSPTTASGQGPQQPPGSAQTSATSEQVRTTKSPSSRNPGEGSLLQSETSSPTLSNVWYEPQKPDNNVSWAVLWESQKHKSGCFAAVLHTFILVICLAIHLFCV